MQLPLHPTEMLHKHYPEETRDNTDATTCASESSTRTDSATTSKKTQKVSSFFTKLFSRMAKKRDDQTQTKKVADNRDWQLQINPQIQIEKCSALPITQTPMFQPMSAKQKPPSNTTQALPPAIVIPAKYSTPMITKVFTNVRLKYHIDSQPIGRGHSGIVRKCMNRQTQKWYAIKSIKKSKVKNATVLITEIDILLNVSHPSIIRLVDVAEDHKYVHIITELCTGGELFDRIVAQPEGRFTEVDSIKMIRSVLDAVAYCHRKNITHRDLKPENFLYQTEEEDSPIKIIDFGLSTREEGVLEARVGTAYYIAPEVLGRCYGRSCDIWSVGVIAYILLCGYPPFYGDDNEEIFERVKRGVFDFPRREWDSVSGEAKDFICCLLQLDPAKRPSAEEALRHKWLI